MSKGVIYIMTTAVSGLIKISKEGGRIAHGSIDY